MNLNVVVISGRLTHDPDYKTTQKGTNVLSFSVACNERKRNDQGGYDDYTNYFDCTVFGGRAEYLSKNLRKGMLVCVSGKLTWQSWERDGQKRSKVSIIANDVELLSEKQSSGETYTPVQSQPVTYSPQPQPTYYQPQSQPAQNQTMPQDRVPIEVLTTYLGIEPDMYSEDVPF